MFTMKNRIGRGIFPRLVILIIIFSALIIGLRAEKKPSAGRDKVKILILSKHIRLLKEGKINFLHLALPKSCEIDSSGSRISCNVLSILYGTDSFSIKTENSILGKGNFILYPKEREDTFSVEVNGEKRVYPLPLYIKNSGSEIELSIEETVNQFAIDSAWGELGNTDERSSEALYALAHLIKARCALAYLKDKHKGYDFCDLTCCQSYKGRSGKFFDDPVSINTTGIRKGLFFHSSGGGTLFTDSIFNTCGRTAMAPKDVIYCENFTLSRKKYLNWEAAINEHDLSGILYPEKNVFLKNINFDRDEEIVKVETDGGINKFSPETFRIRINRIKGWNFIKSNNYILTKDYGVYNFRGSGLGHGAGMSFEGALQLAERGYSRYEILEHYYPEIKYNGTSESAVNHQLQYIVFNSGSGEIVKSSAGTSFRNRIIPCGSIFKLFITLYLQSERKDLFYNYSYTCMDAEKIKEKNRLMPHECWKKSGHGRMNISGALSNSCNKYFASLYDRIDYKDFSRWVAGFASKQGIVLFVPEIKSKADFSNLLAGLNFNVTITVDGLIKLNRYIYLENKDHSSEEMEVIFNALHKTFTDGTAKENGSEKVSLNLSGSNSNFKKDLWGKTGTVIAGTNNHYGYGIFTGGLSSTGIVAILRKGTGAMAAKESEKILLNLSSYNK